MDAVGTRSWRTVPARRRRCGASCGSVGLRGAFLALALALPGLAVADVAREPAARDGPDTRARSRDCALEARDAEWKERAIGAWRATVRRHTRVELPARVAALLYTRRCAYGSDTALRDGTPVRWRAAPHDGQIVLPNGTRFPADATTAMAMQHLDGAYFVMALPSVWEAGGVPGGALGLERLTIAVLLHEGTHVAQRHTYMQRVADLARRERLPADFDDDSIQRRFGEDAEFAAAVRTEMDQLFAAAAAEDEAAARRYAESARESMRARRARWFVDELAYLSQAEDLFLTLEGSGQWAGLQWLVDPDGGGVDYATAVQDFGRRSGWWSQDLGLALLLAVERVGGTGWRRHAFGDGARAGLELLDDALERAHPAAPSSSR